jgi:hypothetical protein
VATLNEVAVASTNKRVLLAIVQKLKEIASQDIRVLEYFQF